MTEDVRASLHQDLPEDQGAGIDWRPTVVLVLIVGILALWVGWVEDQFLDPEQVERREGRIFPFLESHQVVGLTIATPGSETVVLHRPEGTEDQELQGILSGAKGWRLESPVEDQADDEHLRGVVDQLEWVKPVETIAAKDVPDFAFGEVTATVTVTRDDDLPPYTFELGAERADQTRPMRVPGRDEAYLVREDFAARFLGGVWQMRNKRLVALDRSKLNGWQIERAAPPLELALYKTGEFWRVGPTDRSDFASRDVVDAIERVVFELKAAASADDAPDDAALERYGLAAPLLTLTLSESGEGGRTTTLRVGDRASDGEGQHYVQVEGKPFVYRVALSGLWDVLPDEREDAFLTTVWPLRGDGKNVLSLRVEGPELDDYALVTNEGAWELDDESHAPAESELVLATLRELFALSVVRRFDLEADDAPSLADLDLEAPALSLRFATKDAEYQAHVSARAADGTHTMRRGTSPWVYRVRFSEELWQRLVEGRLRLLDASVLEVHPDDLTRVTLTDADGAVVFAARREGETWQVEGQPNAEASRLRSLFQEFRSMSAAGWLGSGDDPEVVAEAGLDQAMTLELGVEVFQVGEDTRTLRIGARTGDDDEAVWVRAEGAPGVARVDGYFLDVIARGFEPGETLWSLEPYFVREIEVRREGGVVFALRKPGANWKCSDGLVDNSAVETFLANLAEVEATHTREATPEALAEVGLDAPAWSVTVRIKARTGTGLEERTLHLRPKEGAPQAWTWVEGGPTFGLSFEVLLERVRAFVDAYAPEPPFPPVGRPLPPLEDE